jgi:pimeloyl-ACP methyl ester carboxylesterase
MVYTGDPAESPAVVLVPGGGWSSRDFFETALDGAADFVVFTFDPLGRGESQGEENMHGPEDQAFLYEVYIYAKSNSNGSVSVASFSYGIAMVAGALAVYDMPIDVWVDWEGPHERTFIAHLCLNREDMKKLSLREKRRIRKDVLALIDQGKAPGECADNAYWAPREAVYMVEKIELHEIKGYHRLQGRNDHVHQTFCDHALEMVNKMCALGFLTQLNDRPQNVMYTEKGFLAVLYTFDGRQKALEILRQYYGGQNN